MPLFRRLEKNAQLMDFKCVEFVEELIYGRLRKQPSTGRPRKHENTKLTSSFRDLVLSWLDLDRSDILNLACGASSLRRD